MTLLFFVGRMALVPLRVALLPVCAIPNFAAWCVWRCERCNTGWEAPDHRHSHYDRGAYYCYRKNHPFQWWSPLDALWRGVKTLAAAEWQAAERAAFEKVVPAEDHLLRPADGKRG